MPGPSWASGAVAVFDLDRTLLPGSSLLALARAMASSRLVSRKRLALAVAQDRVFRTRGSSDRGVDDLRADALRHVAGLDRSMLLVVAADVGAQVCGNVYPGARLLLRRHLLAGDFVVILSASPQELVDAVAVGLGVHRAVGSQATVHDGRFTGTLDGPFCYGPGKVDRLAAELGSDALASAIAYADSASDLPLLRGAAEAVAVNPDRRLRHEARRNGWPIVRFG